MPGGFGKYQIFLDEPAADPQLGFSAYADAFAEIIEHSRPRFSIGIFGGWGSGKTTLMRAIEANVSTLPGTVSIWFNAWRYEKEEHLIVPMLDTLRDALVQWAAAAEGEAKRRATKAASTIARATRALLAGFSISGKLFAGIDASLDANKVAAEWRKAGEDEAAARRPHSFYHASFNAMREAISEFVAGGANRIVVFVDDLDRCLPENALQVLESMKLFFDLNGFVFVVGLEQGVIERAVALKYPAPRESEGLQAVSGSEYVKKIFQVPYTIPPVTTKQLPEFVEAVIGSAKVEGSHLDPDQESDLRDVVARHLAFVVGEQGVNPREIKRFMNAYTLQMKMLHPRLGDSLDRRIVLALQVMNFRPDWRPIYELLAADPGGFAQDAEAAFEAGYWPDRRRTAVPSVFVEYVRDVVPSMLTEPLEPYVSSVEATHFTDTLLLESMRAVRDLWRAYGELTAGDLARPEFVSRLLGALSPFERLAADPSSRPLAASIGRRGQALARLAQLAPSEDPDAVAQWRDRIAGELEALDGDVGELRRLSTVGGAM